MTKQQTDTAKCLSAAIALVMLLASIVAFAVYTKTVADAACAVGADHETRLRKAEETLPRIDEKLDRQGKQLDRIETLLLKPKP